MRRTTKAAIGGLAALMGVGALASPVQAADTAPPFVPPPRLSVGDVAIVEGDAGHRMTRVPLTLSRPLDHDLKITWRTTSDEVSGDGATPGVDFRPVVSRRVTIRAGKIGANLPVRIFDDTIVDSRLESLGVEISAVDDPEVVIDRKGTVVIRDDESYEDIGGQPEPAGAWVATGMVFAVEGDAGRRVVAVPIVLSQPQSADVFVTWSTSAHADAVPGGDFRAASKVTRIPAGKTQGWANVTLYGDTTPERDEVVLLQIKDLRGGDGIVGLPGSHGGVALLDDDTDDDRDRLPNLAEPFHGTDAGNPDSDGDGLGDGVEVYLLGTDPLSNDTDGDGLDDRYEVNEAGTDPRRSDTDGDGFDDLVEIKNGSDPLDPASIPPPEPTEP